jgi:hypothetical protein|tara:strand:+ start:195571 stop:196401 length:831 start_codon:yes stop_codon:yes gene_type:complete
MTTSLENSFIKQFEEEVHQAYQRQGSKLRGAVRTVSNVKGASTTFQKVGKGVASTKSSHGMVPVMNLDHSSIECILEDYYAGDWVDRLDELKLNTDERMIIANAGAYALGRKTDELIINALDTASDNAIADGGLGLTKEKVLTAFELLGENDVPDDGQRYAVIGWKQWSDLLAIDEFSSADYIGPDALPWKGTQAKEWLGTVFIPHSGLPIDGTGVRSCFWFHKTAVGHASGTDVNTDISWHGDRAAHFVNNMMSQGTSLIDQSGIVKIDCDETPV